MHNQKIGFMFNPAKSSWQSIHDLLGIARETGKEGAVAHYLVGAKLQLRFQDLKIENDFFTEIDDQPDRHGDFYIGDTAFHVTVAPMAAVYTKCKRNIEQGLRAYLLVPDRVLAAARQTAE